MTTGATGQLGLALPVQGELSGTWGDTVNNGITQYTNIAIAATLTLTNDGAVTLANTTGDASASNITSSLTGAGTVTAQFAIVRVTGTLTTAKVVTAPSYSKTYTVVNAATGGIVTFKASGQTGVSIAVGESAFVYYNGTDYVKVSGTSAVSSFSAGSTGFTPSTATTGAVTLAGTLATTNGGTGLTSFTSGGVVYASSSSALATGSALTFDGTNLRIGAGVFQSAYRFSNFAGTGTAAGLYVDSNTGEIRHYGDINFYQTFYANNAEAMRLTSTGLGIGTSSPATKLDVNGTSTTVGFVMSGAVARYNNDNFYMQLERSGTVFAYIGTGSNTAGGAVTDLGIRAENNMVLAAGGSEKMRITSAGNVGIGTSSPAAKLHVNLNTAPMSIMQTSNANGGYLEFNNGSTQPLFAGFGPTLITGLSASDAALRYSTFLAFGAGATERARLSNAGGFSVGTTSDPGAGAIYATGNITAFFSDKRLKTVSGKIENALDKVGKLSGVYYTFNDTAKSFGYDSDEEQVGVIAQEVEAVLPQIVKAAPFDLDENNNSKSGENYKTVQYDKLVPLLIEAINELQAKVKALEAK